MSTVVFAGSKKYLYDLTETGFLKIVFDVLWAYFKK